MITSGIPRLRGFVRITNGIDTIESHNLVVYTGGDIIAKLLGAQSNYAIAYMYFGYENNAGVPAPVVPVRTNTTAYYTALVAPFDFIRAPVLIPPAFSASDANHNFNQATFTSIATAAAGEHGVPFGAANNSKVTNLGIVAAPTGAAAGDVLYAQFGLPTALPAAGSGQIAATWMLEAD
jgi:hypothetical protein